MLRMAAERGSQSDILEECQSLSQTSPPVTKKTVILNQRIEEHPPLHIFPLIPSSIGRRVFVTRQESKIIQERENDIRLKQKENTRPTTMWLYCNNCNKKWLVVLAATFQENSIILAHPIQCSTSCKITVFLKKDLILAYLF